MVQIYLNTLFQNKKEHIQLLRIFTFFTKIKLLILYKGYKNVNIHKNVASQDLTNKIVISVH